MSKMNRKNSKKRAGKVVEAPKFCRFTRDGIFEVDYREIDVLRRHVSAQGKISPRKRNGITAQYQRQLNIAIKRARFLGLLPYVGE
jgi:small subunit ribosomal protein S18